VAHVTEYHGHWRRYREFLAISLGYESVAVLLASSLIILGAPVFARGIIEGLSDGASSFVKLFPGYFADKFGKRTGCRKCRILSHGFWMFVIYGDLWQTGAIPGSEKNAKRTLIRLRSPGRWAIDYDF
jgi:hypothetical protein